MRSNITGAGHQGGMKMPPLKYLLMAAGAIAVVGAAAAISVVALNSSGHGKPLEVVIAETPTPIVATATPYSTATPTLTPYPTATAIPTATATATATATPSPTATSTPAPTATATETATATATATATPIASYTDAQLKQMTSSLEEILRATEPALDANGKDYKGYVGKITDNLSAGYFLVTGRTLQQDNISLLPLTKKDFDAYIDKELPYTTEVKENFKKNYASFVNPSRDSKTGKVTYTLVMRGDFPTNFVFIAGAHEAGIALENTLNPNIRNSTIGSVVLTEASANAFSTGVSRALEEFVGKSSTNYTLNAKNTTYLGNRLRYWQTIIKKSSTDYPEMGIVVLWAAAQENGMLKDGQHMSAKDLYGLFQKMVMDDDAAQTYVTNLLKRIDPNLDFIRQNALSRLVPNLPADEQGPASIETSVVRP